ncbi:Eco57I restriction-modification methylase domain-containing protein [Thermodesulfobacteriota bacterium]
MSRPSKEPKHFGRAKKAVTELIHDLLAGSPAADTDTEELFMEAVGLFVEALLEDWDGSVSSRQGAPSLSDRMAEAGLDNLDPVQVGEVYEFLRGHRLRLKQGTAPELIPSAKGKRNQGLFYTPTEIVRHILEKALDSLNVSDPLEYLDVRILDPALGTGAFLGEAMEMLERRVLRSHAAHLTRRLPETLEIVRSVERPDEDPSRALAIAVRLHILENCLYGVDVDPVAVRIAEVFLCHRALGGRPLRHEVKTHLRAGNSLIGAIRGKLPGISKEQEDRAHASVYFGKKAPSMEALCNWAEAKKVFHWHLEFPEIFGNHRDGFDLVVGNPPYEILSVLESGLADRKRDQAYFRKCFETCQGKINTYRLMMERGLDLLRRGGSLGFIVPATLLADSTAGKLREMILDETEILETVAIPEKARIFRGVTQALLIMVTRKGGKTVTVRPTFRDGPWSKGGVEGAEIGRELIDRLGSRVPLIRTKAEKHLLEQLMQFPPLGGTSSVPAVGRVHQGEINLTVDRNYVTDDRTDHPLIRGEHVEPFQVVHPYAKANRLDWVSAGYFDRKRSPKARDFMKGARGAGAEYQEKRTVEPWTLDRIVLARVVNMATDRRLKAAPVSPGQLLGDMTNSLHPRGVNGNYLLGLLNSRLLNWRFKITSTNNYISAKEVLALPIPRIKGAPQTPEDHLLISQRLGDAITNPPESISEGVELMKGLIGAAVESSNTAAMAIAGLVETITRDYIGKDGPIPEGLSNILDALVLIVYGAEKHTDVVG